MQISWREYKNKKYIYVDYRGCMKEQASLDLLYQEVEMLKQLPENEKTLALANYEGAFATVGFMKEVKRIGKEVLVNKIKKTALLGVDGFKTVFVQGYTLFTGDTSLKCFKNENDALEWLIAD